MDQAGNATKKLVTTWNDARRAIWDSSQRILLAVTALTTVSIKKFADFEDAMVEVGAITRTLGTRDFKALEQAALSMGEKTRYTATEAAGGLKQLSLSGLDARQSIEALQPTLELATSSGLSIAQSASISAKMMKAMGIEASGLSHVNDVLVSTFQRSNTDLTMLSEGMKHAAPLAHTLGISLEDVTAILAKMSDAGFQGEMGGTALRNIMSRLAGALPRMTKQFNELGIETLDSAGRMRPILDILQDIEAKGLSAGKIMELFGQRGGPQLLALLEQGIGGIRNFAAETAKAAGAAAAVSEAKMNTIAGQWDELTSFIESIFLEAGEGISKEVMKLLDDTEQFLRANKPEILREMHRAAMGLVDGLQSLRQYFVENKQSVLSFVETLGGVLKWIADFGAAHPKLMAWLVTLKVTGILGLNTAIYELGKAIIVTIAQMVTMGTAATAAAAKQTAEAAATSAATTAATAATTAIVAQTAATTSLTAATTALTVAMGALAAASAAVTSAMVAQGRVTLGLAMLQNQLTASAAGSAGAMGLTRGATTALTVSQGTLATATTAATTALTVQATAAKTTAAVGAASAARIGASFLGLGAVGGPIALAAAAVVGVGLAIRHLRIEAEQETKRIADAFDKMRDQLEARDAKARQKRVEKILKIKDPEAQQAALGEELDAQNTNRRNLKKWLEDPRNKDKEATERLLTKAQDNVSDATGRQKANADSQLAPVLKDASNKDVKSTDAIVAKYEKLKQQLSSFTISGAEFAAEVKKIKAELEVVARGFDPVVEGLFGFNSELVKLGQNGLDVTDETVAYNTLLQDLNKAKFGLGDSFSVLAKHLNLLNEQFAAGVISQEEYLAGLKVINEEVQKPLQAKKTDLIKDKIQQNELQKEKDKHPDFETIQGLVGHGEDGWDVKSLDAAGVQAIGQSIEGATPEIVQELVDNFKELQAQGEGAVQEGMDELILSFLTSVEEAKDDAEKKADGGKAALDAYKKGGTYSDVKGYVDATGGDYTNNSLYQMFHKNQTAVQAGQISQEDYAAQSRSISNVAGQSSGAIADASESQTGIDSTISSLSTNGKSARDKGLAEIKTKMNDATEAFKKNVKDLTDEFSKGAISEDEFTKRMRQLKDSLNKTTEETKKLVSVQDSQIAQEKKIMALKSGNLQAAGVDPYQMVLDKILAIQMQQVDQWVDWYVNTVLGLGNATNNLSQGFQGLQTNVQQLGDGLNRVISKNGSWFETSDGAGNGIAGGLKLLYDSAQAALAIANNNIALVAQKLHLTRLPYSKLAEYQKELDFWVAQRDALLNQPPPMFIGQSSDPFFHDPGVVGGGGTSNVNNNTNASISLNFPGVNKMTSQEISSAFDALAREAKRRGVQFNPIV